MKKLLFGIIMATFGFLANAQSTEQNELSKNNIYFDTSLIPGIHAFINYERRLYHTKNITLYGRTGYGFSGFVWGNAGFGGLGALTMLTGKKNSHFELNAGLFVGEELGTENDLFSLPLLDVGYRYQKPDGGFIFKAKIGVLGVGIGLGVAF
ncbi:MAG: hypothetical protein ACI85Q_002798 [Salibacteraceae bacterium]|jgi:hypothetical protein